MKAKKTTAATELVLRTCRADMTSTNEFKWPDVGGVAEASDWKASKDCGNGLHGWLYGQGDHGCSGFTDETAKWLVVEVAEADIIMLGGKCKFPRGTVRFVGDKKAATDYLVANEARALNVAVIGATVAKGDGESAVTGALGTATAGYRGTATAGDSGTATAGYRGELRIRFYDFKAERYRAKIAYAGEDGIEANTPYRLNDKNEFVKA